MDRQWKLMRNACVECARRILLLWSGIETASIDRHITMCHHHLYSSHRFRHVLTMVPNFYPRWQRLIGGVAKLPGNPNRTGRFLWNSTSDWPAFGESNESIPIIDWSIIIRIYLWFHRMISAHTNTHEFADFTSSIKLFLERRKKLNESQPIWSTVFDSELCQFLPGTHTMMKYSEKWNVNNCMHRRGNLKFRICRIAKYFERILERSPSPHETNPIIISVAWWQLNCRTIAPYAAASHFSYRILVG